jgi:predicted dehydrogenase
MSEKTRVSRRRFLTTAAGGAVGAAALSARNYARAAGANDRLNVAIIGVGTIGGRAHLPALLGMRGEANVEILAVCDVHLERAREACGRVEAAGGSVYMTDDHRDVLGIPDIDYVVVATPEHSHHCITLDALRAGKHVYCEKPLAHTIPEARELVRVVRETGLQLQVGVQGMSDDSYSSAYDAIVAGKIGPVIAAEIEYTRDYAGDRGLWRTGVDPTDPKPDELDWDRWLVPASRRPWDPRRYHDWRCYREYSGGIATDLFVHRITRIIHACGLAFPSRVVGMGGIYVWDDGRDLPDNFEMLAQYPAVEGVTPGMTVRVLGTMANAYPTPHCIRGGDATLVFTAGGWDIIDERGGVAESHAKTGGEDVPLHHRNLQAAIRNGEPLKCPADLGARGMAPVVMANESWFRKRSMRWDDRKWDMVPEA